MVKRIFKGISVFVSALLVCDCAVRAEPNSVPRPATINYSSSGTVPLSSNIFIPESYGRIERQPQTSNLKPQTSRSPQVILVKDAHCHYEAQRNIAKILDILIKEYKIDLVGVEGASGKVDPSIIANSPDEKKRKQVGDKYLKKGWLTASEVLAMEKGKDYGFSIWGVEDLRLYLEDLKAFRGTYNNTGAAERFIGASNSAINSLKNKMYSEGALDFDEKAKEYRENKLGLTEWMRFLAEQRAAQRAVNGEQLRVKKNIKLALKAIELEEGIDFRKVEKERIELIKECERRLPKEDVEQLVKKSLGYKLGKISGLEYYKYLESLTVRFPLNVVYLRRYVHLAKLHSKIDEDELFKEIDEITEEIYKAGTGSNQAAWKLHEIDNRIYLLNRLVRLEITREQLKSYRNNGLGIRDIVEFLRIQCGVNSITIPPELTDQNFLTQIEEFYKQPDEFYRYAIERDKALIDNLISKMEETSKDKAVLVLGGFHADGAEKLLREKDIQVIIITPSITKEDTEAKKNYLARMMDEKIQPEKMLAEIGLNNIAAMPITGWWNDFGIEIDKIRSETVRGAIRHSANLEETASNLAGVRSNEELTDENIREISEFKDNLTRLGFSDEAPGYKLLADIIEGNVTGISVRISSLGVAESHLRKKEIGGREHIGPAVAIIGAGAPIAEKLSWKKFWGPLVEEIIFRGIPFFMAQALLFAPVSSSWARLAVIAGNIVFNAISSLMFYFVHRKDRRQVANYVSLINSAISVILVSAAVLFNFMDTYWVFWMLLTAATAVHAIINIDQLKKSGKKMSTIESPPGWDGFAPDTGRMIRTMTRMPIAYISADGKMDRAEKSVNIEVDIDLAGKVDIVRTAIQSSAARQKGDLGRLDEASIVIVEKSEYLIEVSDKTIRINRFLLELGDEWLEKTLKYAIDIYFYKEIDDGMLLEVLQKIINFYGDNEDARNYTNRLKEQKDIIEKKITLEKGIAELEKDIDDKIKVIREKEGKGEDVAGLYEEVMEKIAEARGLWEQYEETVKENQEKNKIEDTRNDFMIMIPTCDRAGDLELLMESLLKELEAFGYATNRRIHIVVADDSGLDMEETYGNIIGEYEGKFKKLSKNITIEYYSRRDQRNIIENIRRETGGKVDLGFFVNEKTARKTGFGHKGYAGMRNMLKLITAVEMERVFAGGNAPIVLHVDDDMRFSNPLRRPKDNRPIKPEELDEQHIFNYFGRLDRAFRSNGTNILGGGCTGKGGHISNVFRDAYYYYGLKDGDTEAGYGRDDMPRLLGGDYACRAEFDMDYMPLVPAGIRGEDNFLAFLTGAKMLKSLLLSHHQTKQRDIAKDMLNDFDGAVFFTIILAAMFNNGIDLKQEDAGWEKWERIISGLRKMVGVKEGEEIDVDKITNILGEEFQVATIQPMLKGLSEDFRVKSFRNRFIQEMISYYKEIQLRGAKDEEILGKVTEYFNEWREGAIEDIKDSEILNGLRQETDENKLIDEFLTSKKTVLEKISLLRSLLKNIIEDTSIVMSKKRVFVKLILGRLVSYKYDYVSGKIMEKQRMFVKQLLKMDREKEKWREWSRWRRENRDKIALIRGEPSLTTREKAVKRLGRIIGRADQSGENVDKKTSFIIEANKLSVMAKDGKTALAETTYSTAEQLSAGGILGVLNGLNAVTLGGFKEYLESLILENKVMVFTGTQESRAAGAFAHFKSGILYIDGILLEGAAGNMIIIHEALHGFLMDKPREQLESMIRQIPDALQIQGASVRERIIKKARQAASRGKGDYLSYLRHYYARYYLQNSEDGRYNADNQRLTYEIRLNAAANLLRIEPEDLNDILKKGIREDTVLLEYGNRLLKVLKSDGKISEEELRIIVESADKTAKILDLIKDVLPPRISDIQKILAIFFALNRLKKQEGIPKFIKDLGKKLEESAQQNGIDPDLLNGLAEELYNIDGYSFENGKLKPSPYYTLMVEGIRDIFGLEIGTNIFNTLDKYQRAKAFVKNSLKVSEARPAGSEEEIHDIVTGYLKGRRQSNVSLEKLTEIIALYIADGDNILSVFEYDVRKAVKEGLDNILSRLIFSETILNDAISDENREDFKRIRTIISAVAEKADMTQGLYYLDGFGNGGAPVLDGNNVIDRLETGEKLNIGGLEGFLKSMGREYMLLEEGKGMRLLTALSLYKRFEFQLNSRAQGLIPSEWPQGTPLIVDAKLLVGNVQPNNGADGNFNGTYTIEPVGEGAVWLLRLAGKNLRILYALDEERNAVQMWLEGHGIKDVSFITEGDYPYREAGVISMLAEGALGAGSRPAGHKIIKTGADLKNYDSTLMSQMAAVLAQESGMEKPMADLFCAYYNVKNIEELDENIRKAVGVVLKAISEGGLIDLILPPMRPFIKTLYNTLKNAKEIVASAA